MTITSENRKRLVFGILLAVLCLTAAQAYYKSSSSQPGAALEAASPAAAPDIPSPNDGRIRLDLIERDPSEDVGRNNLFQYRGNASTPGLAAEPAARPFAFQQPAETQPRATVQPPVPLPPSIALKYQGFALVEDGTLTAFLSDDAQHYNVTAGEVLMGRFRIARVTVQSVEVEDLQFDRKQTIPLTK